MAMSQSDSYRAAVEIVCAGLSGDGIKLKGSQSNAAPANSKLSGEIDAAYLDALIKGLIKTLGS